VAIEAPDVSKFNPEGEQCYRVDVAIERVTRQVIDKQIEVVNE